MTRANTNADRLSAERRARGSLIRLICAASFIRTALTRILPLTGCAAWWTVLLCLLPGALVLAGHSLILRLTGAPTLTEALRACLGKAGVWGVSLLLGALLLIDAAASMTALIIMFTEGVGTRGTQFTLALLTAAVLLTCLNREGLSRGVHLLRWPMLAAVIVLLAFSVQDVHLDGLFPILGEGEPALSAALQAGFGMAWPLVLLLTVEPIPGKRRALTAVTPCAWCVGLLLLLTLTVPHEVLIRHTTLADSLLLPTLFAPNALRTLGQCLAMLALFLAVGGAVQQCAVHWCAPFGGMPVWLPYAIAALLTLTQAGDVSRLWGLLGRIEPYLIVPLALLALICLPIACFRRKST